MANIRASKFCRDFSHNEKFFHSIVGTNPARLRKPRIASQSFRFGTIQFTLQPNIVCGLHDLSQVVQLMLSTWRAILNSDVRYQQACGNLPAFLGVRNICVRWSNVQLSNTAPTSFDDVRCYPYFRVFIDNAQVAAFIIARWCARTGQLPRDYSVVERSRQGKYTSYVEAMYKSSPFYVEVLLRNRDVEAVKFGAAAEITKEVRDVDYTTDCIALAGVLCSRKFGCTMSVNAMRSVAARRSAQALASFYDVVLGCAEDRCYATNRWRYNRWVWRDYSQMRRSYYGGYLYSCGTRSRYEAARDRLMQSPSLCTRSAAALRNIAAARGHCPDILNDDILQDIKVAWQSLNDKAESQAERLRKCETEIELLKDELHRRVEDDIPLKPRYLFRDYWRDKRSARAAIVHMLHFANNAQHMVDVEQINPEAVQDAIYAIGSILNVQHLGKQRIFQIKY